jgi:hypothetical protein
LTNDFQQLEGTSGDGVAIVKIEGAETEGSMKIYGTNNIAQQFTPDKKYRVYEAWISLSRVGTFADDANLRVSLCNNNAGVPNNTDIALAYEVKLNSIPELKTDNVFVFQLKAPVNNSSTYWIKVKFVSNVGDASNYIKYYYNSNASSYSGGVLKESSDGTTWSEPADDGDLGLQIWGIETL